MFALRSMRWLGPCGVAATVLHQEQHNWHHLTNGKLTNSSITQHPNDQMASQQDYAPACCPRPNTILISSQLGLHVIVMNKLAWP